MSNNTPSNTQTQNLGEIIESIEYTSPNAVFDLLSHDHRRLVLDLLLTHDQAFTLTDLRNEIVEQEHDTEITEIPEEEIKRVHVSLHHTHIPKLAEAGIVIYDSDIGVIRPTKGLRQLEPFLAQL